MKRICSAAAVALVLVCTPALAETVDIATVKCSELAEMDDEGGSFLFAWLLGYQSGAAGTTTLDLGAMEDLGKSIGEYCAANPEVGILSATTEVMSE